MTLKKNCIQFDVQAVLLIRIKQIFTDFLLTLSFMLDPPNLKVLTAVYTQHNEIFSERWRTAAGRGKQKRN